MHRIIASLLLASLVTFADAKPDKTPPKVPVVPSLGMYSNWGLITQDGRKLTIEGHPTWTATGEVRKDGSVYLVWELNADGRRGMGVYRVVPSEDGKSLELHGQWGWGDECELDADGSIKGGIRQDRVYKTQEDL